MCSGPYIFSAVDPEPKYQWVKHLICVHVCLTLCQIGGCGPQRLRVGWGGWGEDGGWVEGHVVKIFWNVNNIKQTRFSLHQKQLRFCQLQK